ncbi:MAG: aldo/keto reductase [Chitinivibrionales bacterium]|nr:aldo/keto reductase [Chitinivibrionales bacterium]
MFYRELGVSGLRVSAVGLGTWAMGGDFWGESDDEQSISAIKAAIDHGVTLIDTAPAFGAGHAEELVGRAVKGRRNEVVIATKGGVTRTPDGFAVNLKPETIEREVDESLKRLDLDVIDLYHIQSPDPHVPLGDTLEAVLRLRDKGKFRYFGLSNFGVPQVRQALSKVAVASVQPHYSLLRRDIERDLVPYCIDHDIGLITYGTLAGGILSGKYREIPQFGPGDNRAQFYDFFHEPLWGRIQGMLDSLRPIASRHGRPLSQVVINWLYWQPGITTVLVGARNADQAISNAEAGEWELSNDELDDIDEIAQRVYQPQKQV